MNKTFYITTPIYYPSADLHIGHCYTTIIADSIARYKRIKGYDTYFLTGTDEHGEKIAKKALEAGVEPKEYVDEIVAKTQELWHSLGISYDHFIRTTDKEHEEIVQKIFQKLYDQGDIYKGEYSGWYCIPCESFWTESQLADGMCPDCNRKVEIVKEESYFFRLSKYQDQLVDYIEKHPSLIQPESRKNEMINNFIKPGLEDVSVSRTSTSWGIPVPFDPKHTIYVWIDALSNYISALGYLSDNDNLFKKYWPADLHLVGKEITRFHVIIWPALLMALGLEIPKQVFGHGWLIIDGGKISKSFGNYKNPQEYIDEYGVDALRYFILREVPFGNDGNFSEEALIGRINGDLANTLGNLVNRTLSMSHKYFNGEIKEPNTKEKVDEELIASSFETVNVVDKKMADLHVSEALEVIIGLARKCNKYIDDTVPWVLAKDEANKDRLGTVIYNLLEAIRFIAVLLQPFTPNTADKIFKQLNSNVRDLDSLEHFTGMNQTDRVNAPEPLFKRIEEEHN